MVIQFEISKIESYSRALAEKICNEFFSSKEAIKGEQIVGLTSIEQVNLFVIKNLLDKWKEESVKLKSPYFDYESSEIKEALQNLLNKLSQNISIRKEFFKPLLEKGIFDTLYFILKPEGFFNNEFANKSEIKLPDLQNIEKYFRINKTLIQQIIGEMEREGRTTMKGAELMAYANTVSIQNRLSEQEAQHYLEQFSVLLKLDLNTAPTVSNPIPSIQEKKEPAPQQSLPGNSILNEKFGMEKKQTLNDLLTNAQSVTLADKIGKSRIENIRGAISLSQRFLFINALFKGANGEYESALSDIDKCMTYEEALELLSKNYALKYNWDFNLHEVKEFVGIVERKFSRSL